VPSLSPIAMVLYGAPVGLSHFSDTSRFLDLAIFLTPLGLWAVIRRAQVPSLSPIGSRPP
jgi:hypothetical protein